ncbi:L,D-transpeptidase [Prosthecobacter sp.]|uniref:L,D-transpeptidase n=1 Tax=Prosthecobacter sp. TaxID=1965333 RepID=UPI001D538A56|nr:L,D-transpeptidase [Prosthecobacter sp.]MCB1277463.1 L,D-transpeptidase [Prosthecobacter sp.]
MSLQQLFCLLIALCLISCQGWRKQPPTQSFAYPRWHIDEERCAAAKPGKVNVDVSLASQTAQLLDEGGNVLVEMDVSPGLPGHETPAGEFNVREKLPLKRSNLYGQYVKPKTGEVVVARTWEHEGPKPAGTEYLGIAMPFWLRLTDHGVGMHVGGFERGQCTSHGCIRCPEEPQKKCWELCRVGTRIRVHHEAHRAPSRLGPL